MGDLTKNKKISGNYFSKRLTWKVRSKNQKNYDNLQWIEPFVTNAQQKKVLRYFLRLLKFIEK